jgi:hypothetical protein
MNSLVIQYIIIFAVLWLQDIHCTKCLGKTLLLKNLIVKEHIAIKIAVAVSFLYYFSTVNIFLAYFRNFAEIFKLY